jgi:MoaA/NifB/PqqE/SkfB family radical SAM enzyme
MPRLPFEGSIDLTYRCNNNCLHCWLRIPHDSPEQKRELTLDEIKSIADQARSMGCRQWNISGGEPILRPDFPEIFEILTAKTAGYTLNTNGTLITPEIARLLKRKGAKLIALYGATKETYDRVTRHPGGFEMVMQGFRYLQEAGAGFIVQLIPMRDNWHEWEKMKELAQSLSKDWRVGAAWLFMSSTGSQQRNREIAKQRLSPRDVIELDKPNVYHDERMEEIDNASVKECLGPAEDDRLFAGCITRRREFHIDPYGGMNFCCFLKDPSMRFDLRRGSFRDAWDGFIPSLADKVHGDREWSEHCGACDKRADCRWCAVYSYLETGRYSARIPYLCAVAEENRKFTADWKKKHCRYFQIAGITVRIESDLNFNEIKFDKKFESFSVTGPGEDNVTFLHHFEMPDLKDKDLGVELYRKAPWAISRNNGTWYYRGISSDPSDPELDRIATFSSDHSHAMIYSPPEVARLICRNGWPSLSLFPTDQIWLAPLLADRHAVLLHSAGVALNGQGMLFVGHSDAGKSTIVTMLKNAKDLAGLKNLSGLNCEILCDDRNVIRRWNEGWRIHGTWSHGDVPDVSNSSAPLRAIFFLKQDNYNLLAPLMDRKEIWRRLLATLIKPMVTAEWWRKELDALERLVDETSFYTMHFDKSGTIAAELMNLIKDVCPRPRVARPVMAVS